MRLDAKFASGRFTQTGVLGAPDPVLAPGVPPMLRLQVGQLARRALIAAACHLSHDDQAR